MSPIGLAIVLRPGLEGLAVRDRRSSGAADRSNTSSSAAEVDYLLGRREALREVHAVGVLDVLAEPTIERVL